MLRNWVLALALFSSACQAAPAVMIPASSYVEATMTMPYYDLVEPITAWNTESKGRLDYWGGVQRYIYDEQGMGYMIVPTAMDGDNSEETCFTTGSNQSPVSLFPNVTAFPDTPDEHGGGGCAVRGIPCVSYTLMAPSYDPATGFDGNYTLFVDASTGVPLRFHFVGFNVVLGSHYDEYIFDYMKVVDNADGAAFGDAAFLPPAQMTCQELETDDDDAGGPTSTAPNGLTPAKAASRRPPPLPHGPRDELAPLLLLPRGGDDDATAAAAAARASRFSLWVAQHGKAYASAAEAARRKAQFHATEWYVNAFNRQRKGFWLGLNHMADWTTDEKAKLRGRLHTPRGTVVPATHEHELSAAALQGSLPAAVDWVAAGAVTPPKDQGSCGSCWSFGATGTAEGQLFLQAGTLVPLSQQNLMDCSWSEGNNACDGGLDFRAYAWMLKHQGNLATEGSYPYLNADGYCRFDSSTVGVSISGYANITSGVGGLNDALANVGPISVSIDASPDSFYFYQGGLYDDAACLNGLENLDHTVLAVGYETEADGSVYTVVKNSWSTHWGDGGFVYLAQAGNICGAATQPTYVIL